jgi:hypothetical protein
VISKQARFGVVQCDPGRLVGDSFVDRLSADQQPEKDRRDAGPEYLNSSRLTGFR